MRNPSSRVRRRPSGGFTIVELLVVIAIIALLIAILTPYVVQVRKEARKTASMTQITQMSTSIQTYELQLRGLPGFFSEAELKTPFLDFTSTENLVLSLMGGVTRTGLATSKGHAKWMPSAADPAKWNTGDPNKICIDLEGFTLGPTEYPATDRERRFGAFYAPKVNELLPAKGEAGGTDNAMPEFLDVGSVGQPILYFRETVAKDLTTWIPVGDNGSMSAYFNLESNKRYWNATNLRTYTGETFDQQADSLLARASPSGAQSLAWAVTAPGVGDLSGIGSSAANMVGRQVIGKYVLIAPGPDGIYFSAEDNHGDVIKNYNEVGLFDDRIHSGGT